jgi:hypothetical protein
VSAPRTAVLRGLVLGIVLVLGGLLCWGLYAVQSGREAHSFTAGSAPPTNVRVVSGHRYTIAIHGGVQREVQLGVQPAALTCTATAPGQGPGALDITAEESGTKATNQIASFTASFSGTVHIECDSVGPVYIDNAADAGSDVSGVWLILASIALVVGIPITLSTLRRLPRASARHPQDDETLVDGEGFFRSDRI